MKYAAVISMLSLFPNITDSVRKLQAEKVRWKQHGLELTEEHIENAREYAYASEPNNVSFFYYLDSIFDLLRSDQDESEIKNCRGVRGVRIRLTWSGYDAILAYY